MLADVRLLVINRDTIAFWMTSIGTVCWAICFWWMHRISANQNYLLERLREQGKRIENLSKIEHDLIKEVHPQVSEIREGVEEMIATTKESQTDKPPPSEERQTP